ncbi:uncharacterized protein [Drosophila bipectinata]|uniref:uncharacterized protein n=1 Tax=Drosophila bipectinata TaxID=42026 RepID=UPI0038B2DDA5
MKRNPSFAFLAMGFAFCAFCPFLATCKEEEVSDLKKGIESLSKIMARYQSEFDNRANFMKLQLAVDEIDRAMMGYQGKAKNSLPMMRTLNYNARTIYQSCVAPVFEWCISTNRTFDLFIPSIRDSNLSSQDKDLIWNLTVTALNSGLEKTTQSLSMLSTVQYKTAELKNLFRSMLHDVADDFGPSGFYGREKAELEQQIMDAQTGRKVAVSAFVGFMYGMLGSLVFGPIGKGLRLKDGFVVYGIVEKNDWDRKTLYKERLEIIDELFKLLTKKIEMATEIVKEIDSVLEEDKTNLHKLRGVIEGANTNKALLLSDAVFLRVTFVEDIQKLMNECTNYVKWHGSDAPFYNTFKSSLRHEAFTYCEDQRLNVKNMSSGSSSQNATDIPKIISLIDQMDCDPYIPPVKKCN